MKRIALVFFILCSNIAFAEPKMEGAIGELKDYFRKENKIVVVNASANGKISYNKAVINLLIKTENKKLASALESNSEIRKKIRKLLTGSGINKSDIKESKFSSTPEYGIFGDEPDSYKVENTLAITVHTESQMIQVAAISDKEKNVRYISSKPALGDQSKIKSDLLEKALAKVKNKVEIYQNNLNIKLIPESFEEISFNIVEADQIPRLRKSKISSYSSEQESVLNFGETEFTITLRVIYRVTGK